MILLGWAGIVLMVAAAVLAIVARKRLWGLRLQPPVPSSTPPDGWILLAAQALRGRTNEISPLLADWEARGVLTIVQEGPHWPPQRGPKASGPEWHFTVRDASRVGAVELPLLQAFVPDAPTVGANYVLRQDDAVGRDRIFDAIYPSTQRQRAAFAQGPGESAAAIALVVLAIAAPLVAITGFAIANAGPYPIAWSFMGGLAVIILVSLLGSRRWRPGEGERRYRQQVADFLAWLPTSSTADARYAGWAMIENLPGIWATGSSESIRSLVGCDRHFLRGDFAQKHVPRAYPT